jgi:hypothetical protein
MKGLILVSLKSPGLDAFLLDQIRTRGKMSDGRITLPWGFIVDHGIDWLATIHHRGYYVQSCTLPRGFKHYLQAIRER